MHMKRLLPVGLALALFSVAASALPSRWYYETVALTRAAPTASEFTTPTATAPTGVGVSLVDVKGCRVSVCAESGQTLSGGGNLRLYLYHLDAALPMRSPSLDLAVTSTGVRCQGFPDLATAAPIGGRALWAPDAVTVSGGTTVTTRIDCATGASR